MTPTSRRTPVYLNVYGSRYTFGLQGDGAVPATVDALVAYATRHGLAGLELPVVSARAMDRADLRRVRDAAERDGFGLILSSLGTEPIQLRADIELAAALGARVLVTAVAETRFGGDRRHLAGQWHLLMRAVHEQIAAVVPDAEKAGVVIALENHQDLDALDMLSLCRALDSEAVGVTFDCANALGVAEHPMEYLRAVLPYVVHAHMKDYRTQWTDEGYALIRCPVGSGVVPLPELVSTIKAAKPGVAFSIEIGALVARVVRVFAEDFWADHRPRSPAALSSLLGFVGRHADAESTDLQTPFERATDSTDITGYEEMELEESIAFVLSRFDSWIRPA